MVNGFSLEANAQRIRDITVICVASWAVIYGSWSFVGKPQAESFILKTVDGKIREITQSIDELTKSLDEAQTSQDEVQVRQEVIQSDIATIRRSLQDQAVTDEALVDVIKKLSDKLDE